jgi:hypothetical protein
MAGRDGMTENNILRSLDFRDSCKPAPAVSLPAQVVCSPVGQPASLLLFRRILAAFTFGRHIEEAEHHCCR